MITEELQKKVDMAIRLLQSAAPKDGSPIEVAYSGGKDSDVILQLVKESGIPYRAIYKIMNKIMNKIKEYIIHVLGGYTAGELNYAKNKVYLRSRKVVATQIKTYLDSLYGASAEDWCKMAYERISLLAE